MCLEAFYRKWATPCTRSAHRIRLSCGASCLNRGCRMTSLSSCGSSGNPLFSCCYSPRRCTLQRRCCLLGRLAGGKGGGVERDGLRGWVGSDLVLYEWIEYDWTVLQTGLDMLGYDWIGYILIGLDCIGLSWTGYDWIGFVWTIVDWVWFDWILFDWIWCDCIWFDWIWFDWIWFDWMWFDWVIHQERF